MAVIISPVFRKGNWGSGWLHASPKAHNYSKAKPGPKLSLLNFWPSAIVTLSCSLPSCIVASAVHPALGKAESRVILEKVHFSLWHLPHVGASASVSWNPVPLWLWLFYGVCTFLSVCMEKKKLYNQYSCAKVYPHIFFLKTSCLWSFSFFPSGSWEDFMDLIIFPSL
jgi:hypothetical protein